MRNIGYLLVLTICYFSLMCYASDIPLEELIRGVNQARLTIQSGEVKTEITIENAATKTEEEIAAFIQNEKEQQLKDYVPEFNIDAKTFEKTFLVPYLNYTANWDRQHIKIEHATTLFQVMEQNTAGAPELYSYKLTFTKFPGLSLDSETAQRDLAGDIYFLAYDTQTQVRMSIGNILSTSYFPQALEISDSELAYGYRRFPLFGKSLYRVPADAKRIGKENVNDMECQVIAFTAQNKRKVKIWVDESLDFCVRRFELARTLETDHIITRMEFKDFQQYKDVWFPKITIQTVFKKDGKVINRDIIKVISAEFNVDFPNDFFKIDKSFYQPPGVGILPGFGTSPTLSSSEEETLLLLCGPQSLLYLCELLKVKTNIQELKKLSGFDPIRGTTMKGLKEAATYKGLAPKGVISSLELLKRKKVPLPAIAYVDSNHFLVFESVNKEGLQISDPAKKYDTDLAWDEISEIWDGQLLIVDKKKRGKQKQVPLAFADAPVHDFGKVLGGGEIKHTFTIKNIGQKPLKIVSVTETCACTASILTKDEILPGKTGKVSSVLKVPSENRLIQENILIHTNDPIQNTLTLTFKGEIYLPLTTFPERFVVGTHKPLEKPLEKRVSLHLQDGVEIIGVRTDSKHMKAALSWDGDIPMIDLQLLKTLPVGKFSQQILVDYNYNGEKATHNVYIYGEIVGDLHVTPNRLFFGLVKDTSSFSKTITITSRDTQPFEITATESSTKAIKVTVAKDENETSYQLTTIISPEVRSGEVSGEVIIYTSSSVQPTVRVPFFGIIAQSN